MKDGDILEVTATDLGFIRDIESWCKNTGNSLLEKEGAGEKYKAKILKGNKIIDEEITLPKRDIKLPSKKEKTMIIFDGDLDKDIASFIIATGAQTMGNKVHMFFTLWGLSILRKDRTENIKKDFMSKMFSMMLPKGSKKLKLSKMNFLGMGPKMIRNIMKKKGVKSLEDLIKKAIDMGVEITDCQMSMDIMGLKIEELIDGVKVGGVATMLEDNDNSNMNLFI
ncbi:DsrE/DsrF/DrsH-like family protein [uncultured Peptoniphilus sp.]|uniref:DsrE/DsrF/DrsH-like family protein n=1 Tax=uncultured Peptoniphilus sp. TaxID=254354 RepID=UPI0028045D99|nr:DsrE/DsrF/DrsH-like family protein [uncultured Peptoniphilus sp.]